MNIKTTLLILLTLSILPAFGQNSVDYLRTNNYDRIKLSLDDLKKISTTIQYYFDETPKDSSDKFR